MIMNELNAYIICVPTNYDDDRLWELEIEPDNEPTPDDFEPMEKMIMPEWKLPDTPEAMERASERFRVATVALKELGDWLDHKGENPPECVIERAKSLNMTSEMYYAYYQNKHTQNWLDDSEQQAITDWAIHQVQPYWQRNPNPNYPKHWGNK